MEVAQPLELGWQPARSRLHGDRAGGRQQLPGLAEVAGQGVLARAGPGPGVGAALEQLGQGRDRVGGGQAVAPLAAARVELVVAEQPVPVGGQQVDRVDQEVGDRVGDEPVEADPEPSPA